MAGRPDFLSDVVQLRRPDDELDRLGQSVENLRESPPGGIVPRLRNVTGNGGKGKVRAPECVKAETEAIVVAHPCPLERTRG